MWLILGPRPSLSMHVWDTTCVVISFPADFSSSVRKSMSGNLPTPFWFKYAGMSAYCNLTCDVTKIALLSARGVQRDVGNDYVTQAMIEIR